MCQISEILIQEEKLLIIKKLIDKNMSVEEISDIVDLSVEEIQKLLNKTTEKSRSNDLLFL